MPVRNTIELGRAEEAIKEAARDGLERGAEDELQKIDEGFETGTDALGRPWEPLSAETIRRKGHDTILVDRGDLRQSFGVTREGNRVYLHSDSPIIGYHEWGTRTIPRRPILGPARADLKESTLPEVIGSEIRNAIVQLSVGR